MVGDEMAGVTMLTFHGLALRLTGRSLAVSGRRPGQEEVDFARIIADAIRLLKGESEVIGFQDIPPDYALIGRFSHILVDEYQDIDKEQYELVSLIAGKSQEEGERKMTILAVGDDDQNIYRFRGASVEFIRKFQHDYSAEIQYLVENYRSTAHIIAAANCLIANNTDRMKTGHPIQINEARQNLPPGGNWQLNDPIAQGKVQILEVENAEAEAAVLLEELQRLRKCGPVDISRCAVLAREWKDLEGVRSACEGAGVPVSLCWGRHAKFPRLTRIRENADILELLQVMRSGTIASDEVLSMLQKMPSDGTVWSENLKRIVQAWGEETGNTPQPVPAIEEYLYEALSEQGRSKSIGNGLSLATAHSIKGQEFDHVFILGDSWSKVGGFAIEDERRLYYVSMSRARETLNLFSLTHSFNPYVAALHGDFLISRRISVDGGGHGKVRTYHVLGMEDLFLDFAGIKPESHPSQLALKKTKAGDKLGLEQRGEHIEVTNSDGVAIARLSRKSQVQWADKLKTIKEIRTVALVRRYRDEVSDKDFQASCLGHSWEVPLIEIFL